MSPRQGTYRQWLDRVNERGAKWVAMITPAILEPMDWTQCVRGPLIDIDHPEYRRSLNLIDHGDVNRRLDATIGATLEAGCGCA